MFRNLMAAAALSAFVAPAAFAAKDATLTLSGKVPEECEIVVQESGDGKNILDLAKGAENLNVGTISEKCNGSTGYTVTVQFKNGKNNENASGAFRDTASRAILPFFVTYGGKKVVDSTITDSNTPAADFVHKDVLISYDADPTLPASSEFTYAEQMRFTISAK